MAESKPIINLEEYEKLERLQLLHIKQCPDTQFVHFANAAAYREQPPDPKKKPNGWYPDNFTNIADLVDIFEQLKEINKGRMVLLGQPVQSIYGTLSIRFEDKKGKFHYFGFLDINSGIAHLTHRSLEKTKLIRSRLYG